MCTLRRSSAALACVASLALAGAARAAVLTGTPGNDMLRGGPGDDVIDGGPGADDTARGRGIAAVTYAGRPAVVVTIDDLANDGPPGEHDNVQTDIEDVYGGDGADALSGSAGANTLEGGPGDDLLSGGGGS